LTTMGAIWRMFLSIKFRQKETARLGAKKIRTADFGPGVNQITVMARRFVFRKITFEEGKLITKPFQDLNFAPVSIKNIALSLL
jgi:hypothetical protein